MAHVYLDFVKFLSSPLQSKLVNFSLLSQDFSVDDRRHYTFKRQNSPLTSPFSVVFSSYELSGSHQTPSALKSDSFVSTWDQGIQYLKSKWVNQKIRFGGTDVSKMKRKKVVVVGTGWGSVSFLPSIDVTKYEVSVVSPRNYFTYTSLLPCAVSGTLSCESCMEPIRGFTRRGGKEVMTYYEAKSTDIDIKKQEVTCASADGSQFQLPYDYLVLAMGATINTFGIPGVMENALFLKEIPDARSIRNRVLQNLERASAPGTSEEEKKQLLQFVIIGGGPTGVESAAEIYDFVKEEGKKYYEHLFPYVKVTLVEMLPKLLPAFSEEVSQYTKKNLSEMGVEVLLQTRVTKVEAKTVTFVDTSGKDPSATPPSRLVPYGMVIWATGVGQTPFAQKVLKAIPEQNGNRVIRVDPHLVVNGTKNVYALGDCSYLTPPKLEDKATELYNEAKGDSNGAGSDFMQKKGKTLKYEYPQFNKLKWDFDKKPRRNNLSFDEFKAYLKEIDSSYRPPAPTAQNASQEGSYLAATFNKYVADKEKSPIFDEKWKGNLAYVGNGSAVAQLPTFTYLGGFFSGAFWKWIYLSKLLSWRARWIYSHDWLKQTVYGRSVERS